MLAILDYGAGNQTSVKRALDFLGIASLVTADPRLLPDCDGIIFPGVGAAGAAMRQLEQSGLARALHAAVERSQPLLGICLGCQIMLQKSAEGPTRTLGILPGECLEFSPGTDELGEALKIPHMGWNRVRLLKQDPLWEGIPPDAEFYFVHSYYVRPKDDLLLGLTAYGGEFCSVYGRPGLWAVQFHPEKSGRPGLRLLQNFNEYCGKHVIQARHSLS